MGMERSGGEQIKGDQKGLQSMLELASCKIFPGIRQGGGHFSVARPSARLISGRAL